MPENRSGIGYDAHRLVPERKLTLGGVHVPYNYGLQGHSDGDVLIHAVIDSLLGAASLGDIGTHFPSSDPELRGISSISLLRQTKKMVALEGWEVVFLDGLGFIGEEEGIASMAICTLERIN